MEGQKDTMAEELGIHFLKKNNDSFLTKFAISYSKQKQNLQ